jgi:hypothetical protein
MSLGSLFQTRSKLPDGPVQSPIQRTLILGRDSLSLRSDRIDHDPSLVGQVLQSLWKAQPLALHHKTKDIAPNIADPTLPTLSLGIDLHARTTVVMERTTSHKISTLSPYLRIPGNNLDNVDRQPDSLLGLIVKSRAHGKSGVYKRAEFLVFPTSWSKGPFRPTLVSHAFGAKSIFDRNPPSQHQSTWFL